MQATASCEGLGLLSGKVPVAAIHDCSTGFEFLIEVLRECSGIPDKHQLVIRMHGRDRTNLLMRVVAEELRDTDLLALFLLVVIAMKQHEIAIVGEFWLA